MNFSDPMWQALIKDGERWGRNVDEASLVRHVNNLSAWGCEVLAQLGVWYVISPAGTDVERVAIAEYTTHWKHCNHCLVERVANRMSR